MIHHMPALIVKSIRGVLLSKGFWWFFFHFYLMLMEMDDICNFRNIARHLKVTQTDKQRTTITLAIRIGMNIMSIDAVFLFFWFIYLNLPEKKIY